MICSTLNLTLLVGVLLRAHSLDVVMEIRREILAFLECVSRWTLAKFKQ